MFDNYVHVAAAGPTVFTSDLIYDVTDPRFGAKGDGNQDDTDAVRKCVDTLIGVLKTKPNVRGTIYFPPTSSGYTINRPIFIDYDRIQITGGGAGTLVQSFSGQPIFLLGVYRNLDLMTSTLFPDAYGKLDTSVAPDKKWRTGLRTGGTSAFQFQANSLQFGRYDSSKGCYDYWTGTTKMTVEVCLEFPATPGPGAYICGIGPPGWGTWYLLMGDSPNVFRLGFRTDDIDPDTNSLRFVEFSVGQATGPLRLAIHLDLDAGVAYALVNDVSVQTTVRYSGNAPAKPWGPGLRLQANEYYPFFMGLSDLGVAKSTDVTFYGLAVYSGLRYPDPGVGKKLATPPNDGARYFDVNASGLIALLRMVDSGTPLVSVFAQLYTCGYRIFMDRSKNWSSDLGINNMKISGHPICGQAVCVANVFSLDFRDLDVSGSVPIGSLNTACSYPVNIENCRFEGSECSLYLYFAFVNARNTSFRTSGRDTARFMSCNWKLENTFVARSSSYQQTVISSWAGGYGSYGEIDNMNVDFEGYTVSKAIIYAENNNYVPDTQLYIKSLKLGSVGQDAAVIMLRDKGVVGGPGGYRKAWLSVDNCSTNGNYRTFLDTNGPAWAGEVNAYFLSPANGPFITHTPKYGPTSPIKFNNDTRVTA